jgi:hypothetical protein
VVALGGDEPGEAHRKRRAAYVESSAAEQDNDIRCPLSLFAIPPHVHSEGLTRVSSATGGDGMPLVTPNGSEAVIGN